MSKDKHKGVARRKYALANLHHFDVSSKHSEKIVYDNAEPDLKNGRPLSYGPAPKVRVNVTKAVKELEKKGLVKRYRGGGIGPSALRTKLKCR